jgi:hypothetical protein
MMNNKLSTETQNNEIKKFTSDSKGDTAVNTVVDNLEFGLIQEPYDNIELMYIESGNGEGEIGVVIYKMDNMPISILSLEYDNQNRLISVTKDL